MHKLGLTALAMLVCGYAVLFQPTTARAADIAVSGFNLDVVTDANPATRFGNQFGRLPTDFGFTTDWVENLVQGSFVTSGLPSSRVFTSATGSGVTYHLQPYSGNNVLRMGGTNANSGVMTVVPGQYSALHILSASATDGFDFPPALGQTSDVTLNFADGSVTLPNSLLAYDWFIPNSQAPASAIAIGGLHENALSPVEANPPSASSYLQTSLQTPNFGMYETALDLNSLGLSGRTLNSITFNDVNVTHSATGVFAVDGTAAPEPGAIAMLMLAASGLLARRPASRRCE
jgi:hypothetical protein